MPYNPADPLVSDPSDVKSIPAFVRRCWMAHQSATTDLRKEEKLRLKFYDGGDGQWREEEMQKRRNQQRPWVTINRCKPAVDQIEGDIRQNPPGPQAFPVGAGSDGDVTDIIEGLIREVEYRSEAMTAYSTAVKYSGASGYGVIELASEFLDDRSFSQRLVVKPVEDPAIVFFDPDARMPNRQDAMWAGKLKKYTRDAYIAEFGKHRAVLKPKWTWRAAGWIQDAFGRETETAMVNEWTGNGAADGPYYVCEFNRVEVKPIKLKLHTDNIARFDDEPAPAGVKPKDGDEYVRLVGRRKVFKYVVDALEVLKGPEEWLGNLIPLFPVLGPEVYIEGKLHRGSAISNAIDPQRGLNYAATSATEMAGSVTKAPWIGPKGSFDDPRWKTANTETWAYLEYTPVWVTDEINGQRQLAPPPQRNTWDVAIQWTLALAAYFSDAIKAVTSIYDPSLGQTKADQSGRAIAQLRSESSTGTFSYADNLHRAISIMYGEMCVIFPKILDGPRVVAIVRPNSQHEMTEINQEFPNGIDPATGQKGKTNNIALGQHSARVTVGPSFDTRQREAVESLTEFFKASPQTLAVPGVAASYLRMIGEGNPEVEGMADLLSPPQDGDQTPAQLGQQLQQAKQQSAALTQLVQQMHQAIQAKLPQVEADKFKAALDALTKIRVAEINASKDADNANADREASLLETQLGMAHDLGLQAHQQDHAQSMADQQAQTASQQSAQDASQNADAAQAAAAQQPQETGG